VISRRSAMAACGCCSILALGASACPVVSQSGPGAVTGSGRGRSNGTQYKRASASGERPDGSGLPDLHHIGFVVADRDRALAGAENAFGFGRAHRFDLQSPTARVTNGVTGFNLRAGFVWMGNILLEFLEPVDDRSPHALGCVIGARVCTISAIWSAQLTMSWTLSRPRVAATVRRCSCKEMAANRCAGFTLKPRLPTVP
jgi:hypothetical protein